MLLEESLDGDIAPIKMLGYEIVASQIFGDDPPEVWASVQRLIGLGLDRDEIFIQMSMALFAATHLTISTGERFDQAAYARFLDGLPLPDGDEFAQAIVAVVREAPGIDAGDLRVTVFGELGCSDDEFALRLIDETMDILVDDGVLDYAVGDRVVHVGDLFDGIALTRRLSDAEQATNALNAAFDLAAFTEHDELSLPDGEFVCRLSVEPGHIAWVGPQGWLDDFEVGACVAVRVDSDGALDLTDAEVPSAPDDTLVRRVRDGYDRVVDEPWLPVGGHDLLLEVLAECPTAFDSAQAPLSELCEAAGLEVREAFVAHNETVWHTRERLGCYIRLAELFDGERDKLKVAIHVIDIADLLGGMDPDAIPEIEGDVDPPMLRDALDDLGSEFEVLDAVATELIDVDAHPKALDRAIALAYAFERVAGRGRQTAVVRWLRALLAECRADLAEAEQQLELAVEADQRFAPAVDRLAWYASDRGDARKAATLWRRIGSNASNQDLAEVDQFIGGDQRKLGRNAPCWCGSGRKYKLCHLDIAEQAPLPDRVGWLCRKAVGYLERRLGTPRAEVADVLAARVVDPDDEQSLRDAIADPIVMDLVLTEDGWFASFLEERGELLPEDEAMLARSWLLVERTVYEVIDIRPGAGLALRDLRTGDRVEVRERTFSQQTRVGGFVCGRAVPDGETHQFVGGLFPVAPGVEKRVLEMLDDGDPIEIAEYVSSLYRPPVLLTREREPSVACSLTLSVRSPTAARTFLNSEYEPRDDDSWIELFAIDDDEDIIRAHIALDGHRLTIDANSEERADRVLSTIVNGLDGVKILRDEREPIDLSSAADLPTIPPSERGVDLADLDDEAVQALSQLRDKWERNWCSEEIPALGGLTPRQAAADPTRRDELERLIASFEQVAESDAVVGMRPARLRELLDLPPRTAPM